MPLLCCAMQAAADSRAAAMAALTEQLMAEREMEVKAMKRIAAIEQEDAIA